MLEVELTGQRWPKWQRSRRRRRFRSIRYVATPSICPSRIAIGGGISFCRAIQGRIRVDAIDAAAL